MAVQVFPHETVAAFRGEGCRLSPSMSEGEEIPAQCLRCWARAIWARVAGAGAVRVGQCGVS